MMSGSHHIAVFRSRCFELPDLRPIAVVSMPERTNETKIQGMDTEEHTAKSFISGRMCRTSKGSTTVRNRPTRI